ncbi:MAG: SLBB domain-containing protein [Simkaniaceae bacterium]|nr:SLBB domain-containing protein [Candidatus Sacchlamyda saccharinae]
MRFLILLLFFAVSCTNPPYKGRDVCGADDFVIDSYQIQEGKFGILEMEGECYGYLDEEMLDEYVDQICDGDTLQITLHHPTRIDLANAIATVGNSVGYTVFNGKVQLPELGSIEVGGLCLAAAKEKIQEAVSSEIRDAEIFLSYKERPNQRVELMGLTECSSIAVDGKMRLFEVLSLAKVPACANLFKSYVVRDGCMLPVDLYKLVKEGDMCQNIVMRGGDKVYIADPSASPLMVLGEVNKQRVIDLPNGFMSLRQALAEAGGLPITGDKRYIQIMRGNVACPKIYTLNWEHVVRLPTDSLLLIPGDIVYVAATPIAEWDRFVEQILPTLVGIDLITRGTKNIGITLP